jgi:hypothetical protein
MENAELWRSVLSDRAWTIYMVIMDSITEMVKYNDIMYSVLSKETNIDIY